MIIDNGQKRESVFSDLPLAGRQLIIDSLREEETNEELSEETSDETEEEVQLKIGETMEEETKEEEM